MNDNDKLYLRLVEDSSEKNNALEKFDTDNYVYAYNYINDRCNKAELMFREVAEAVKEAALKHGEESKLYKDLYDESVRIFYLQECSFVKMAEKVYLDYQRNDIVEVEKSIDLLDFYSIRTSGILQEKIDLIKRKIKLKLRVVN